MRGTATTVILALLIAACAGAPGGGERAPPAESGIWLFRAATAIQDEWQPIRFRGETEYRLAAVDGRLGIRAVGRRSASGLIRRILEDTRACPSLTWSWHVDRLQPDAALHVKEREDVAASIFLMFGDPGFLFDPVPVPTLRYVWTNSGAAKESVVDSPYLPGTVRSLVVRSGEEHLGTWVEEERNVAADFETAFGTPPKDGIHAIALFTDNDQTGQAVEAYYGWASLRCPPR